MSQWIPSVETGRRDVLGGPPGDSLTESEEQRHSEGARTPMLSKAASCYVTTSRGMIPQAQLPDTKAGRVLRVPLNQISTSQASTVPLKIRSRYSLGPEEAYSVHRAAAKNKQSIIGGCSGTHIQSQHSDAEVDGL